MTANRPCLNRGPGRRPPSRTTSWRSAHVPAHGKAGKNARIKIDVKKCQCMREQLHAPSQKSVCTCAAQCSWGSQGQQCP
eukprot:6203527-Pleurochrysis_carterae.AAC.1